MSDYLRDLIRKDKAARDEAALQAVKAQLQTAFAAPRQDYQKTSADDIHRLAARST